MHVVSSFFPYSAALVFYFTLLLIKTVKLRFYTQLRAFQRLTGQTYQMLSRFGPALDLSIPEVIREPTAQVRGMRWASRYLEYARTQLLDLSPDGNAVRQPPLEGFPPPNLLIGYYYFARGLNLYLFNQRVFSNFSYQRVLERYEPRMLWTMMADCSYDLDVSNLFESLDDPNEFGETLYNMQHAVLRDRILTDQRQRIGGHGLPHTVTFPPTPLSSPPSSSSPPAPPPPPHFPSSRLVNHRSLTTTMDQPVSAMIDLQNAQRRIRNFYDSTANNIPFTDAFKAAGISQKDQNILAAIRNLKIASLKFILLCQSSKHCSPILTLPYRDDWLNHFVETFSTLDLSERETQTTDFRTIACCLSDAGYRVNSLYEENNQHQQDSNHYAAANESQNFSTTIPATNVGMAGGAIRLRSGTIVGLPFVLRPRRSGRAVTQDMRRRRGHVINRFIDSLPIRTRQRRPPREPTPDEPDVEEEPQPGPSGIQTSPHYPPTDRDSDDEEGEDESDEEEEPELEGFEDTFANTVLQVIALAIAELRQELGPRFRNAGFFDYTGQFYRVLADAADRDEVTEDFLTRWLMYFFLTEHVAATLFYLERLLNHDDDAGRYLSVNVCQTVIRARGQNGEVLFTRVWDDRGQHAFLYNYQRVLDDLLVMTNAAGRDIDIDVAEEQEQLLEDLRYRDNSGDPREIFRQVALNDLDVRSLDLSFRVKLTGYVAYTTNRRWARQYTTLRDRAVSRWRRTQPRF